MNRFPTVSGILYYGRKPTTSQLKSLRKADVALIWNLASELNGFSQEEMQYLPEVINANISDLGTPQDTATFLWQLNKVVGVLKNGGKVFVGCFSGICSTGLALACIDIMFGGKNAEQAILKAKSYSGGPNTLLQKDFVRHLAKHMSNQRFMSRFIKKDTE